MKKFALRAWKPVLNVQESTMSYVGQVRSIVGAEALAKDLTPYVHGPQHKELLNGLEEWIIEKINICSLWKLIDDKYI